MGVEVLLERRGWPGPVVGVGGFVSAEPFDVDGEGGQDVLDVRLGQAAVAAAAGLVSACELGDGALGAASQGVELVSGGILLVGTVAFLGFVEVGGRKLMVRASPLVHLAISGQEPHWRLPNRTTA